MNFVAPIALVIGLLVSLLFWFAWQRRQSNTQQVGSLFLWSQIPERTGSDDRRLHFDLLLWIVVTSCLLAALAAARPLLTHPQQTSVALFVETTTNDDNYNRDVERAKLEITNQIPNADIEVIQQWMITPSPIRTDDDLATTLSEFRRRYPDHAYAYLLNKPDAGAQKSGLVVARTPNPTANIWKAETDNDQLILRSRGNIAARVDGGLDLMDAKDGRTRFRISDEGTITSGRTTILVRRNPLRIGRGDAWTSENHGALFRALAPSGDPLLWLGSDQRAPAIRIHQGTITASSDITLTFDSSSPLFDSIPLDSFRDLNALRLISPNTKGRPLISASLDGKVLGHLCVLSPSFDILSFAGDPFSTLDIETSTLLLDNAIGVVLGHRASDHQPWRVQTVPDLPTKRQVFATTFATTGEIKESNAASTTELASYLAAIAGLLSLFAGARVLLRRKAQDVQTDRGHHGKES